MAKLQLGAQLYTVREAAAQDFPGTLRRVAALGYTAVELAGTFGVDASNLKQLLNELGLICVSAHVPLNDLRQNLAREIETYTTLGAAYLICPWLAPDQRGDAAAYQALATELDWIGEQCRANNLQLCYHHHDFELVQFDGQYALDILLTNSDPANLKLEADTYWLKYGGVDPASYLKRWSGRVAIVHLKDMSKTEPVTFAEVGAGILDWPGIFDAAAEVGTQWYLVEQDTCPGDPFKSLEISLQNLRDFGVV